MHKIMLVDVDKDNLWPVYALCSCVLVLKMMTLTWFTGRIRVSRQVIHSEEDRMWMKDPDVILCPTGGGHPDVNRIRSAHRYDLETVLPYLVIVPIWLNTSPSTVIVKTIVPAFSLINILHTLLHMEIIKVHSYCKTILSSVNLCILGYTCVISMIHYL